MVFLLRLGLDVQRGHLVEDLHRRCSFSMAGDMDTRPVGPLQTGRAAGDRRRWMSQ